MVSHKAYAPKREAATQKLSKKASTATEKARAEAKKQRATEKTKTNAAVVKASSSRADASALATTSGSAAAAAAAEKHSDRGKVLYVGHLPRGFYEEQLRGYFSQFGAVTRVRLSRVKKTGKPKSYAFLEFANPAVAEIAADAMDGYLMFSQRLSVKVLAPEAVHPTLFKGANRTFTKVPWKQLEAKRVNKKLTAEEAARRRSRAAKADAKRAERIEKSGIDYQYERLLESILNDEEEPAEKKEGKKKIAATASKGTKAKAAAEEAAAEQQQQQPAKKKAKKTAAASSAAPAAAKTKKPAAKEAAAAPAAAGAKKTKRGPVTAAATATLSSKRARG